MTTEEIKSGRGNHQKSFLEEVDSDDVIEHKFPQNRHLKWYDFFYDRNDGSVCRRTTTSWCHILIFYAIFYACLISVFAVCVQFLIVNLPKNDPKIKKASPGVSFQPAIEEDRDIYIYFNRSDSKKIDVLVKKISSLVDDFNMFTARSTRKLKMYASLGQPTQNESKLIENYFGNCTRENHYGYKIGQPCILVQINKVYGFVPVSYDIRNLPKNMPSDLKKHIQRVPKNNRKRLWVSCLGLTLEDAKILGRIVYYPAIQGISVDLFPFYAHPIAVQFPNMHKGKKTTVECRIWAKNVKFEKVNPRQDLTGSVTFDIHMD